MKILRIILISLISLVAVTTAVFFLIGYFKPKKGGILVSTQPSSSVYIDGKLAGKTPFEASYDPKVIAIKLVPDDSIGGLIPYETQIKITSGIKTVVRREFGQSEDKSSGYVITFDKLGGDSTGLIIISTPENAQVSIDGIPQGFAPYKSSSILPAKHGITIKAPGYTDRVIDTQTITGLRLSLYAKLAKTEAEDANTSQRTNVRTFVQILNTPTGFLRVRTQPGKNGEEIAQVTPGSQYPYIDTDTATGWFEIQYEASAAGLPNGISGWVSNEFSKIITVSGISTEAGAIR